MREIQDEITQTAPESQTEFSPLEKIADGHGLKIDFIGDIFSLNCNGTEYPTAYNIHMIYELNGFCEEKLNRALHYIHLTETEKRNMAKVKRSTAKLSLMHFREYADHREGIKWNSSYNNTTDY